MKTVRFGIIGLGMMGREFAMAVARWSQLMDSSARPVIVGVCDQSGTGQTWFRDRIPGIEIFTNDYRVLLSDPRIDALYCAVPHHLHQTIYLEIIGSGKHWMGEKPFGIDQAANAAICRALAERPGPVVRCSSEFPFFPGCRRLISWIEQKRYGKILEVRAGFCHSSDLDQDKPLNWKRRVATNGDYGVMGDLGLHVLHVPLRMGWVPRSVYALLSRHLDERTDGRGGRVACETWDNATLACRVDHEGSSFPMVLEMKRMAPGMSNTWYLEVDGLEGSARFSTADPQAFHFLEPRGTDQAWSRQEVGYRPQFPTLTGSIFEFGFPDALLQMWATFLEDIVAPSRPGVFDCLTPAETTQGHRILTAALDSHASGKAELLCI